MRSGRGFLTIAGLIGAGAALLLLWGPRPGSASRRDPPPPIAEMLRDGGDPLPPGVEPAEAALRAELATAWMGIGGRLRASGDPEAAAWADALSPLILDLRPPGRAPLADLEPKQRLLLEALRQHPSWIDLDGIGAHARRIEALLDQYQ